LIPAEPSALTTVTKRSRSPSPSPTTSLPRVHSMPGMAAALARIGATSPPPIAPSPPALLSPGIDDAAVSADVKAATKTASDDDLSSDSSLSEDSDRDTNVEADERTSGRQSLKKSSSKTVIEDERLDVTPPANRQRSDQPTPYRGDDLGIEAEVDDEPIL